MDNKFDRFVTFGSIADESTRKYLAEGVFQQLQKKTEKTSAFVNTNTGNFATAIDEILSNHVMKEFCSKDPELAEKITQDILDFINKTKKHLYKTPNPFIEEIELKEEFQQCKKPEFKSKWTRVCPTIKAIYEKKDFDASFYEKQFKRSLSQKNKDDKYSPSFESVKEHFTEKWDNLLLKKKTKWELEIIEEQRKKFCEDLYKQIDELKKFQEALEPFTAELGRLWDMSKGNWQRINLDILKRYAELLQRDKTLKELAEMLGRMRHAEKEYEEALFANIQLKPDWKVEHASKADLIGIHESDDLSSLLPSETALLADEITQSVFFKKFAEKKLQTFEYQARMLSYREEEHQVNQQKEKAETKGPFIICVDTSGSMHGPPETIAKTLCFAILKMAIRDNRKCYLISFSTEIETLNLTDLKNSLDKIIAFLSMSFQGGTDTEPAMKEALKQLQSNDYKKADVLMISDFVMPSFEQQIKEQIKSAKENKTKFHSLVIGSSQNQNVIAEFDNNWFYDPNRQESILTLVKYLKLL